MSNDDSRPKPKPVVDADARAFADAASRERSGFLHELYLFLRANKKWWLVPMLAVLLILGALVVLGGTAVAPFIYTLF